MRIYHASLKLKPNAYSKFYEMSKMPSELLTEQKKLLIKIVPSLDVSLYGKTGQLLKDDLRLGAYHLHYYVSYVSYLASYQP